jgi:hypothetical protein
MCVTSPKNGKSLLRRRFRDATQGYSAGKQGVEGGRRTTYGAHRVLQLDRQGVHLVGRDSAMCGEPELAPRAGH